MESIQNGVLVINGGSSSIKFALYTTDRRLRLLLHGAIDHINSGNAKFNFTDIVSQQTDSINIKNGSYIDAANFLINWFVKQNSLTSIKAIGHRIVHGFRYTEAKKITPGLLNELKKISKYDPEHLPGEIRLIKLFQKKYPALPQVACFDTAFHTSMPAVAKMLPIPRKYYAAGIRRYGFHGLSYSYLLDELKKSRGSTINKEKIILAHLGNGASLAAIKNGKSIDTSMGFTPTGGIPMSTRTGDLDPGVATYLMQHEKMSATQFNQMINHKSGLLGISETDSDMRELLKLRATDPHAAEAIDLFCYQTKKYIGAFAAALDGLDTLVFSGGIGENSPQVREGICKGLGFLGIELDRSKNKNNEAMISSSKSKIKVHVIKTNEELMIAKLTCSILKILE